MFANSGVRERAFNLRISAQLSTLWRFKNTFPHVHESGGDLSGLVLRSLKEDIEEDT